MVRAYESTRTAVAYVRRREGDVDARMPSLFGGRPRRRSALEPEASVDPSAPTDPSTPTDPSAPTDSSTPTDPDATGTR
ncbi:MAG TPA: hypothetical protein VFS43_23410 [Polyangiaceae bacterium]|nr:hypothetical protein [Polyangiaceae bacterium]